ncbi:hypothetical protein BDZ89DRAFT_471345 [Hymenopellis radicata]|nr:hypothetical protein BDZ89DRAFT_471345 [Hymenopellis radicata]
MTSLSRIRSGEGSSYTNDALVYPQMASMRHAQPFVSFVTSPFCIFLGTFPPFRQLDGRRPRRPIFESIFNQGPITSAVGCSTRFLRFFYLLLDLWVSCAESNWTLRILASACGAMKLVITSMFVCCSSGICSGVGSFSKDILSLPSALSHV